MHHSALETICDKLLSSFAFRFKLRRYNLDDPSALTASDNDVVGRCMLTLSNSS